MADLFAPLREAADRMLAGETVAVVLPPDPPHGVPFWIGLAVDHIVEHCPLKRPGARPGRGLADPYGTDICGWCARVWKASAARTAAGATCRAYDSYCGCHCQATGQHEVHRCRCGNEWQTKQPERTVPRDRRA